MKQFNSPDDLKQKILSTDETNFFDEHIKDYSSNYFPQNKIEFCAKILSESFDLEISPEDLLVVGSAKIGYALHEKKKNGIIKNSFREYDENSDIDLSICSKILFEKIWLKISTFAASKNQMPFRMNKFGDYLSYGWFRPDHLDYTESHIASLLNSIRIARGKIRKDYKNGHPKIDFGIFYSFEHLKTYQIRSINICKRNLENPL